MASIFRKIAECQKASEALLEAEGDLDMLYFSLARGTRSELAAEVPAAQAKVTNRREALRERVSELRALTKEAA